MRCLRRASAAYTLFLEPSSRGNMVAKSGAYRRERAEGDERNKRTTSAVRPAENTATNLDRLIHELTRLAIVSALAVNESLTFSELKKLLKATDGNLSVHARKLEEAKYVACTKSFRERMPRSEYRLTSAGRQALERYLAHMEALIRAARE